MTDAGRVYGAFLDKLSDLADELESGAPDEDDLGTLAAELGPLSAGMVGILARRYGASPDEEEAMEAMALDELLAYLAEKLHDDEVMLASRAAAAILAARRWLHYGSFARPDDEEVIDFEDAAAALKGGLDRLLEDAHGDRAGG